MLRSVIALVACFPLLLPEPAPPAAPYQPKIAAASKEAELALAKFKLHAGFTCGVWAAEPMLANPVAFCFDEKGRCYVAETYRLHDGVIDIRNHMRWLDDDLACRTVAERLAFMRRRMGRNFDKMDDHPDRIVRLADPAGVGRATESVVVSEDFRAPESGLGSGLLARGDDLWFTNIPALWRLRLGPNGQALEKKALHEGYGVHFGFIGHDLHGLILGPDGKLYFSIGDRGATVPTAGINNPDSGCVFRCNPDGSELELFATGLRNPQELAFDDFGNLFTHDNNCDAGDQARVTYLLEGGDHGWRIGWQFFEDPRPRAAWMGESLWKAGEAERTPHLVPPLANLAAGPSGLVFDPGTGLPEKYAGSFFVCDFHGGSQGSGVLRFRLQPKGAGFEVKEHEPFVWNILATDVDFGPDGAMYILDWTEGWNKPNKGRIYRVTHPGLQAANVKEVAALLRSDLTRKEPQDLIPLLGHGDRRVRLAAQFALVDLSLGRVKGATDTLLVPPAISLFASQAPSRVAKAQALMTLAMIAKHEPIQAEGLLAALADEDSIIREVAVRGLGTAGLKMAGRAVLPLLKDPSLAVRRSACQTLGQLRTKAAVPGLLALLEENNDRDAFLRAAACIALARIDDRPALHAALRSPSPAVRRGVAVALRRLADPKIADLLQDADPTVVKAAAFAIAEVPIPEAFPALAELCNRPTQADLIWYAALNAAYRLGGEARAQTIAQIAARPDLPELVRHEAVEMLAAWAKPNGKCRFTGLWRPLSERPQAEAVAAVSTRWKQLLSGPDRLVRRGLRLLGRLPLPEAAETIAGFAEDRQKDKSVRQAALEALKAMQAPQLGEVAGRLLNDPEDKLRAAALRIVVDLEPAKALPLLQRVIADGTVRSKQAALEALADLGDAAATGLLRDLARRSLAGDFPAECELELWDAYRKRDCPEKPKLLADRQARLQARHKALADWADCLTGGDAERGKAIFRKQELTCLKCHKFEKEGGEVGPELTHIGKDKDRTYLLESIVRPNATIAKGYDAVVILTTDGKLHTGVLKSENDREVLLLNAEGDKVKQLVLAKEKIDERKAAPSAMPEDLLKQLPPRDLRDLIEFLATRK